MRLTVGFRFYTVLFVALSLLSLPLLAQVPQVPSTLQFADMTLHLTEQARRDIQADVDALYRSPKYFQMKLERVDMYLPIIEPIFAELGIPDDIKYLVIQESALISDAVSSSNAVGFWQFKEASATEVGMRVDRQVDDRMNIAASTAGAARYLLRSNATFNNWLYALQSYQMGLGGASRSLDDRYYGAQEMKIDGNTYWYVKKFLSHLVAFRDAVGQQPRKLVLYQYKGGANKTLEDIALEFDAELERLVEYNKWLKTTHVPGDREYVVIVPVNVDEAPNLLAEIEAGKNRKNQKRSSLEDQLFGEKQKEPEQRTAAPDKLVVTQVNGMRAVVARPGDHARDLAKAGDISMANFIKFNDMRPGDAIKPGQVYYFKRKKKKATVYRYALAEGESLWDVSQKYGLRMDKLLQKNRLKPNDAVKPGQVLWLRYIRPAHEPVAYEAVPKRKAEASAETSVKTTSVVEQGNKQPLKARAPIQQEPVKESQAAPITNTTKPVFEPAAKQAAIMPDWEEEAPSVQSMPEPVISTNTQPTAYTESLPPVPQQPVQADTPEIKPAPHKVDEHQHVEDSAKDSGIDSKEGVHLFPEESRGKRNIYQEKEENKEEPAMQLIERKRSDPDSFGVKGPVNFIGEEGGLEQQAPVRATPQQAETVKSPAAAVASDGAPEMKAVVQDSIHVVQAGETLYSISRKWGISIQELRQRNNMAADAPLAIGQQLRLKAVVKPAAAVQAQQGQMTESGEPVSVASKEDSRHVYHTVAEGETMYRVARKYNVTIKDIMEWNKKSDFTLKPGEVLIVSKK